MTVHISTGVQLMSVAIVSTMFALIAYTYTDCVRQGHCPKFLPTISDTWVYPPENYVSRWVVGNVCIVMALAQYAIFRFDQSGFKGCWDKALLYIGFASCVLLSFVGAICDSTVPSCRGNNTIHSTAAVSFFIGYNLVMIVVTIKKPDPVGASVHRGELALALGSILAKFRFIDTLTSPATWGSFPLLAVVEWSDVAIICTWTLVYLYRRGKDVRFGVIDKNTDSKDTPTPLDFWSLDFCSWITTIWYIGTLALSAAIYKAQGRWPAGGIPYISDTWVYPPGNWLSRWACVGCGTVACFSHLCVYYLEKDSQEKGRTTQTGWMTVLSIVAVLGVTVVGCVDESEDITIHVIAATTFFAGYDLFMVLIARQFLKSGKCCSGVAAGLCAAVCIAAKLRFHAESRAALVALWPYIPQALEWTDAITMGVFFLVYFGSFGSRRKDIGLALYKTTDQAAAYLYPDA